MTTPIVDFVKKYAESDTLRLHMPGHKGTGELGAEAYDITEIAGADSLYDACGIIRESEQNASLLFGSDTFYSAEGSSLCIRAMLYLTMQYAEARGKKRKILAGRNAHKVFLSAAALLDIDTQWITPNDFESYLTCQFDAQELDSILETCSVPPVAVYITSPDYLGNTADISKLSKVCHKRGVLLLVDNAHGAYLRFLPSSLHPTDLGADLCCDSAHKTLPVLTGGAYLHISHGAPKFFSDHAKRALAMFGSTSPSYLILQSLDAANRRLNDGYREQLAVFIEDVQNFRDAMEQHGYRFVGKEPLKLTVSTKHYGYRGERFAELLRNQKIECEFADPDFVVLMLTPQIGKNGLERLGNAMRSIPKLSILTERPPEFRLPERVMSVRKAMLGICETLPVSECLGRILACATVSCPPAIPIVVSGERIDATSLTSFSYYGFSHCTVVAEKTAIDANLN